MKIYYNRFTELNSMEVSFHVIKELINFLNIITIACSFRFNYFLEMKIMLRWTNMKNKCKMIFIINFTGLFF